MIILRAQDANDDTDKAKITMIAMSPPCFQDVRCSPTGVKMKIGTATRKINWRIGHGAIGVNRLRRKPAMAAAMVIDKGTAHRVR